jgi:hypothetical protein
MTMNANATNDAVSIDDYDYEAESSYKPLDEPAVTDDNTGDPVGDAPEGNEPPAGDNPPAASEPASLQDALIQRYGLDEGTIEYDGQQVAFSDLSATEQADVLAQLVEANTAPKESAPAPKGEAAILLDLLDKGMTMEEIAAELSGNNVAALSDDEVNARQISEQYPELTEAEVQAELEYLKQNPNYKAKTAALRRRMQEAGTSTLASLQAARQAAYEAEIQGDIEKIRTTVADIREIDGYDIDPTVHQQIMSDLTEVDEHGNSRFINALEDPKLMYKARFYDLVMPSINQYWQNQVAAAEQRGYEKALGKMPAQPQQPDNGNRRQAPAGKQTTTPAAKPAGYDPMMELEDTLG